ncbi:MAG: hypothetical protein ACK484_15855, partial [Sphingobacteriales bacterium]
MKHVTLSDLSKQLTEIEKSMLSETKKRTGAVKHVHPLQQNAARNLIHYLTLRNKDIRNLQDQLHIYGLSSLASAESHIR